MHVRACGVWGGIWDVGCGVGNASNFGSYPHSTRMELLYRISKSLCRRRREVLLLLYALKNDPDVAMDQRGRPLVRWMPMLLEVLWWSVSPVR